MLYARARQEYDGYMQESLVKLLLGLAAFLSLAVGVLFLVFAGSFVTVTEVEATNVGWLRGLGASVLALQGFGLLIVSFRRRDTNLLLGIIAFATTAQAAAAWYSLVTGEYGTMRGWASITFTVLATVTALLLWVGWLSRRKSVGALPDKRKKSGVSGPGKDDAALPPEPDAELVEEIDSQSPRYRE
jgi:hypothetical protein